MKLQFKGQTYFKANTQVQTVSTDRTACFRGQKYQIRVPVLPNNPECQLSASIRKYRGISYIVGRRELPDLPESRQVCYR